ncbi:hypothetical protein PoB_002921900 [Plakobranchus ocellatus]|uniref:Uncharacterized protein n=1 Tax=Plakobranchus ocellatus TaxID=259542 RepID=A0AAV4A901_9GAST|nr:hypothetical protein PoB_002921900 [Plakobranchus ocellatus]
MRKIPVSFLKKGKFSAFSGASELENFGFLCKADPQEGDLRLSRSQAPLVGLEPATEGSLQISGRARYPVCRTGKAWHPFDSPRNIQQRLFFYLTQPFYEHID